MKELLDLDTFCGILSDKGYDGYFTTQAAYPGKIKESILGYLQSCSKGTDTPKEELLLSGYLQWQGEDTPRVECHMWVKHQKGTFDLQKMQLTRKDRFGQILEQRVLTNLSVASLPKQNEAINMVKELTVNEPVAVKKHFRR